MKIKKMRQLIDSLKKYDIAYYSENPLISDSEYDTLYFTLKQLEKETGIIFNDSPTQKINYEIKTDLAKVTHPYTTMLSLDKTKDWNEILNFVGHYDSICTLKLDGLSCRLIYDSNGQLIQGQTRGDGVIGEDITHNIKVINNIPKCIPVTQETIIDGEIICKTSDFERINYDKKYSNERNYASGSIRLLNSKEASLRHLSFIAWDFIKGEQQQKTYSDNLDILQLYGFEVTPYSHINVNFDYQTFKKNANEKYYPIDGLVIRYNDNNYANSLGETSHHKLHSLAFKFFDEEYETELLNIEWTMGRTGKLTPVACFKEVEIGGAMVAKANLHNVSIMKELFNGLPYENDIVSVYRANDVIPQISKTRSPLNQVQMLLPIPDTCPYCGGRTEIVKEIDSEVLMCTNPDCEGKLINKFLHFVSKKGLDIKGLSEATLEKLIDWEWVASPVDLYSLHAHEAEWKKKPGFGTKSVENILNAIAASKNPTLQSFLSAIGIPLIGRTASKELVKYFNTYEEFRNAVKDDKYSFVQLDGFASSKANNIKNFDYTEADKLYEILGPFQEVEKNEVDDSSGLAGATVVITGKLVNWKNRSQLQSVIESKGGKVVNSISKNTTFLINNDKNSGSAKNVAANRLGIPIITEDEFITRYL